MTHEEACEVEDRIGNACLEFQHTYHMRPDAIALGPHEYFALYYLLSNRFRIRHEVTALGSDHHGAMTFMGLRIELKTDPGYSFIVDDRSKFTRFLRKPEVTK